MPTKSGVVEMKTTHLVLILALGLALALAPAAAAVGPSGSVEARVGVEASAEAPAVDAPSADDAVSAADGVAPDAPAVPEADVLPEDVITPLGLPSVDDVASVSANADADLEASSRAGSTWSAGGGAQAAVEALAEAVGPEVVEKAPPLIAAAGFLAVLQALGAWRLLGFGAFAMYSRLAKSELLDNTHRDRVFQLIRDTPGLGVSEIAQRTSLGWGTTVYHLDRLERAQMVTSERGGLHRCYFPIGTVGRDERKAHGLLKGDTTRSIATFLVGRPGATQTEMCEALGMTPSAASKQLTKLENAGLVRREREWKTVRLFPEGPLPGLVSPDAPAQVVTATPAAPMALAA